MRIGEVVVFGASNIGIENFVRAVCQNIHKRDNSFCIGNLPVNEQLSLFLYGVSLENDLQGISWDMFSSKVIGYIVLFDWEQDAEAEKIQEILNFFPEISDVPVILTGTVNGEGFPLPERLFEGGLPLTTNEKLFFCKLDDPKTCRKAMISLLDISLDRI